MKEPTVEEVVAELRRRHRVHTVILYGSRARGAQNEASDWDLLGIRRGPARREVRRWRGQSLDVFVESEAKLRGKPGTELLRLSGGRVLLDSRGVGRKLLARVEAMKRRGPRSLLPGEAQAIRAWAWKMIDRLQSERSAYADYRRAELLTVLLPSTFELKRQFFPGPKPALARLPPRMRAKWTRALRPGAPVKDVVALVRAVVGERR